MTNGITHAEKGYAAAEFLRAYEQFYVDATDRKTLIGCGDDREITMASAEALAARFPDAMPPAEGFTSIYGGIAGIAKNVIVTGVAQYGPSFIAKSGGCKTVLRKAVQGCSADDDKEALIPALHSAANKEHSDDTFNQSSIEDIGCAYASGLGATSALLVGPDSLTATVARQDQITVHGNDDSFDHLLDGHREFLQQATDHKGGAFALNRADYIASGAAIMILAGIPHTAARHTALISNYKHDSIRGSNQAAAAGKRFYNQDIARITAATLRVFAEYNLEPELLMRAFLLDSTPVRAVLASHDDDPELHGKLDPRNVPLGVRGTAHEALTALKSV